jgi:hypothetical protein
MRRCETSLQAVALGERSITVELSERAIAPRGASEQTELRGVPHETFGASKQARRR